MATLSTPSPPVSFAIMRNCHEALRMYINHSLDPLLEEGDFAQFQKNWSEFQRALRTHMEMEDTDMFPLLNSMSDISQEKFGVEHEADHDLAERISKILDESGRVSSTLYSEWRTAHLAHLTHEEKIMTPMTMKTGPTPETRAVVAHNHLVAPAFQRDPTEFAWFHGFNIRQLSQYGSSEQAPNIATRVYAHGLQSASTPTQWSTFLPAIRENCPDEIWKEMVRDYFIDTPGKQPEPTVVMGKKSLSRTSMNTPNPPIAFALIESAHEVLRMQILHKLNPSFESEDFTAFGDAWVEHHRVLHIHKTMEDLNLFPLLNSISGNDALTGAGIENEHIQEDHLAEVIMKDLEDTGRVTVEAYETWREAHLSHLTHEEDVMMPLIDKSAATPEGQARAVHNHLLVPAFKQDPAELVWFIGFCVQTLFKFGSMTHSPLDAVRIFTHGLQAASTHSQWSIFSAIIRVNCSDDMWQEMVKEYHIDSPGKQPDEEIPTLDTGSGMFEDGSTDQHQRSASCTLM